MIPRLYKHNGTFYMILRMLKEHQVTGNNGIVNMEYLKAWRDHVGADHVLKDGDTFLLCQTVQEANVVE